MAPPKIKIGKYEAGLPASRVARITIGVLLILGGIAGFLPILGFWMIPLGIIVISYDVAFARRLRRRFLVWWNNGNGRRAKRKNNGKTGGQDAQGKR